MHNYGIRHQGKEFRPSGTPATPPTHCERCGTRIVPDGMATGYAISPTGERVCYTCCADDDRAAMVATGKATLYLTRDDKGIWWVSNWPGTLRFPFLHGRKGKHNLARTRMDVWFVGPDGAVWHGTQYGEWTMLCHCKRTKR